MFEFVAKSFARELGHHAKPTRRALGKAASTLERELAETTGKKAAGTVDRKLVTEAERAARRTERKVEQAAMRADELVTNRVTTRAERVLTAPTLRNKVTFHVDAPDAHKALLESIRTSKDSFLIETFIWHNDEAGNEVIQALADRIKRAKADGKPYDAKVLIDWFGLRQGTGGASDTMIVDKLRAAGVDVKEFATHYVHQGKWLPITHRKLYIKDGESFMTGGRNIGDEYLKSSFTNPKGAVEPAWHDLLYTVEGDETGRIIDEFYRNWERMGGQRPLVMPTIVPHATGRTKIESVITDPHVGILALQKAHLDLIAAAEREITVMYPYLSDDKLVKALIKAKQKNPNLKLNIILPASKEASAEGGVYSLLNQESARQLMKVGAQVRMYAGPVADGKVNYLFSHFKGIIVDREIVSVGSANGDARTFMRNHELNTLIADKAVAEDFLRQVADRDWADATPLTKVDLGKDTWLVRLKQKALELFDFLL